MLLWVPDLIFYPCLVPSVADLRQIRAYGPAYTIYMVTG